MDPRPNLRFAILWKGREVWPEKQWQWEPSRVKEALVNDELVFVESKKGVSVYYKQYLRDENGEERGTKPFTVLEGPYTQRGTAEIEEHFGDGKVFPFPKPSELIEHLVSYIWEDENAIILDFFAGSCPTAEAVLRLNRESPGNRRFLMVQLPEPTDTDSAAHQQGFATIAEIGKERIRRAIEKMKKEAKGKLDLKDREHPEDLGFRVFKLAESHFRRWTGTEEKDPKEWAKQMELFVDPLLPGWDTGNVIQEVALREGYSLTSRIEQIRPALTPGPSPGYGRGEKALTPGPSPGYGRGENVVCRVTDEERGQSFLICLDDKLKAATPKVLGLKKDDIFICRDVALTDELAANLALQCRLKTI